MGRRRVVILGAGFGGLACARALDGSTVDVTLVDRQNYHVFTPLLYQVASSLLNPSDIAFPVRKVFRSSSNVRFRQASVRSVDLEQKRLYTDDGDAIPYDYVVIAAGSATNFFGNAAIERRALGLKTLGEALQLRNHILACLERAAHEPTADAQRPWLTFVIVGGGPTGVEYAGALAELMRLVVAWKSRSGEYPGIVAEPRILLCEGRDRLLGAFSEKVGRYTEERLAALGVEVRLSTLVQSACDEHVTLSGGERLACRTLVWSAGVKPADISRELHVDLADRSKRVEVDEHLRIGGRADAFAIGDIAAAKDDGHELPMLSAPAMQQGRHVARFILAHGGAEPGEPLLPPFRYVDKGTMATIGRNAAVCSMWGSHPGGGWELTGFLGWLAWLVVHIYYLIGFRNRLVVLWSWFWNYVYYDRPVRIIVAPEGPPKLPSHDGRG